MYDLGVLRPVYHCGLVYGLPPSQRQLHHFPALVVNMVVGSSQHFRVPKGGMHGIPVQGVSIHIVKSGVPGRNLRRGDPIGQLLPRLEPLDGPVVTTQFGGHFQTVVQKYHPVACRGGMTPEEVHVVTVQCHYEIPKGSLIS